MKIGKKITKILVGFGIFGAGVVLGKQFQKTSHEKKTVYAGILNLYSKEGDTQMYVAFEIPPEELVNAADVIFRINKLK